MISPENFKTIKNILYILSRNKSIWKIYYFDRSKEKYISNSQILYCISWFSVSKLVNTFQCCKIGSQNVLGS